MKKINTVRYAVVGLNLGMEHIRAILKNPKAKLTACCDINTLKLNEIKSFLQQSDKNDRNIFFTEKYEDILNSNIVDAILIALPTNLHADFSIKALQADKHVFCEKPLTESLNNAFRIHEYVRKTRKIFQLGYCVRSSPFHKKCLEIINGGSIGKVTNVWWNMFVNTKNNGWRTERKYHGGKLFDCGCHYLDILTLWANASVLRVCAFGNPLGATGPNKKDIPEIAAIIIEFGNGVKASFLLSQHSANCQNSTCGIVGTNGKIEGDPYYPEKAGSLSVHANDGLYKYKIIINGEMTSSGHLGFMEQHDSFINAILNGTPPACSIGDGIQILRLMHAIDKSISTGRTIYIKKRD